MAGNQTPPNGAGRVLGGRYRLVSPIARGGMAEVWEGYDVVLSRPVAVKVLQAHLAADEVFLERFRREAITAARLSHPGIVSTFDTGLDHGTAYIVMELVRGRNLRQYMSDTGPLPAWQAVAIARQVVDALAYAHQAGLVHRDVKPANVLLVEDEWGGTRVKVTDFGIAKAGEAAGTDLTRTGMVLGTPKYLSPEQIKGEDPDARADLYSVGVLLFEMLAGAPPYVGETDMATALAHLNDRVPKVSSRVSGIPPGLDRLVSDLLAKDPDKRVGSAIVVRQRLDALGPLSGGTTRPHTGQRGAGAGWRAGWGRGAAVPGSPYTGPQPSAPPRTTVPSTPTGFPYGLDPVVHPSFPPSRPAAPVPTTRNPVAAPDAPGPSPAGGPSAAVAGALAGNGTVAPAHPSEGAQVAAPVARAAPLPGYAPIPSSPAPGPPPRTNGAAVDATVATPAPTSLPPSAPPRPPAAHPSSQGPDSGEAAAARSARRFRRSERIAGGIAVTVVALGALVAAILFVGQKSPRHAGAPTASGVPIAGVTVFMADNRPPDDPSGARNVVDGSGTTYWSTDPYRTAQFGNLYPGIGLDIQLSSSHRLHELKVTTLTPGWTAQTYVSASPVASGQGVAAWGAPTDTRTATTNVTTFDLKGSVGEYVLFWLVNLGSPRPGQPGQAYRYQAQIAEVSVS